MLDVYVAPTLEKIVDLSYGSSKNLADELRINSYKSLAFYVACFRGHPAFNQIHMSRVAHDRQWSRNLVSKSTGVYWLSIDVIRDLYDEPAFSNL